MPGIRNMLVGIGLAIVGLLITGATYAIAPGGYYLVAWGAMAVGGLQFVVGLFQFSAYKAKGPEARQQVHAQATVTTIVQAMLVMCTADGTIHDEGVNAVATIYGQIFGQKLEHEWIKSAAVKMLNTKFDVAEALDDRHSMIESSLKPLIFQAAYLVAAADGNVTEGEAKKLTAIASGLRMTESDVQGALAGLQT